MLREQVVDDIRQWMCPQSPRGRGAATSACGDSSAGCGGLGALQSSMPLELRVLDVMRPVSSLERSCLISRCKISLGRV